VGAWIELALLQAALHRRLGGAPPIPWPAVLRFLALAVAAAQPAAGLWWLAHGWPHLLLGPLVVALYAVAYLAAAHLLGIAETDAWTGRLRGRLRS
jgi:putative peptidoglycan lipid II flippase